MLCHIPLKRKKFMDTRATHRVLMHVPPKRRGVLGHSPEMHIVSRCINAYPTEGELNPIMSLSWNMFSQREKSPMTNTHCIRHILLCWNVCPPRERGVPRHISPSRGGLLRHVPFKRGMSQDIYVPWLKHNNSALAREALTAHAKYFMVDQSNCVSHIF